MIELSNEPINRQEGEEEEEDKEEDEEVRWWRLQGKRGREKETGERTR